jgi:hypothetical protein
MARMQRTQIYLEPEQAASLDRLARSRGTTRAHLLRLAAARFLAEEVPDGDDPILGIVGLGSSGTHQTAAEHDRVLADQSLETRAG